jgi:hypothetical protein
MTTMTTTHRSSLPSRVRRPELSRLDRGQRERVRTLVRTRRLRCPVCGGRRFEVGDALYVGFLFVDTELDEYMVALTCKNPSCPAPRTGVALHAAEFLDHDRRNEGVRRSAWRR